MSSAELLDDRGDLIQLEDDGGWIFTNRSHPPGSSRWSLNIVKGPANSRFPRAIGIPVFGGSAVFQRMPTIREGRLVCSIKLGLALNVYRPSFWPIGETDSEVTCM